MTVDDETTSENEPMEPPPPTQDDNEPPLNSLSKRDQYTASIRANPELYFVSQPQNPFVPLEELKSFAFDRSAGDMVTIYPLDGTADLNHEEFGGYDNGGRWTTGQVSHLPMHDRFGRLWADVERSKTTSHGTYIASKVVGKNFGVAKGANLIAGRGSMHRNQHRTLVLQSSSVFKILNEAINDINSKREDNPNYIAIVVLSLSVQFSLQNVRFKQALKTLRDMLVAVASAHIRRNSHIQENGKQNLIIWLSLLGLLSAAKPTILSMTWWMSALQRELF